MSTRVTTFTERERAAWAPPECLPVSNWADKYRILEVGKSSEPGPWRTERTPYLKTIMDAMGELGVQEVVLMKTPQVGGSEAVRNALGTWIDQDPGPTLIVFPTEPSAKENIEDRILPMVRMTPKLNQYLTGVVRDLRQTVVKLRNMEIYPGHAGSPNALATRPCRYVICDEVDKYPPFSGRESDPVSLADQRTKTYSHRKKLIQISTPTTKAGQIWLAWEQTPPEARFRFHLACPQCGKRSPLLWRDFRWDKGQVGAFGGTCPDDEPSRIKLAYEAESGRMPIWWQCPHSGCQITTKDRHNFLQSGEWISETGEAYRPQKRVAFHTCALYSPWVSWEEAVGKFLRSRSSHALMMDFMNGYLGEPFEEELNKLEGDVFLEKARVGHRRGVLPTWTRYVLATADTGGRDAWFVVRAWGAGYKSRLIDWGHVHSLEELGQLLRTYYPVEGDARPAHGVDLLLVDSGGTFDVDNAGMSRTDQVYKWSLRDRRIAVLKGTDKGDRPVSPRLVTYRPPGGEQPYDVTLNLTNVHYFKDVLAERVRATLLGDELWQVCEGLDDVYCQHMTAEHRILEREGRKARYVWRPIAKGLPNHLWDCEVYQGAAADMIRVDLLPPPDGVEQLPRPIVGKTMTTRKPTEEKRKPSFISKRPR
jgi:phage terminase large subunit GpA-like protein